MYLAMNRFQIAHGFEEGFEKIWRERDSFLSEVPGFRTFSLLKGLKTDHYVLYASHTVWDTESEFTAWTESDAFRKAHGQTSAPKGTYLGHPELETFQSVL
ncbi:MAG: heme-degrading monooxygenase HmoA [Candidatus Azotimanducaceae bacterium]|jgi:heme-degrading monooxygenase HmoA